MAKAAFPADGPPGLAWHFLYFGPLPQGQGSLRPISAMFRMGQPGNAPYLRTRPWTAV
jgi:hypothetical protein